MWAYRFDDSRSDFFDYPFPLIHGHEQLSTKIFQMFESEKDAVKSFINDIKLNIPYNNHYEKMKELMQEMEYRYAALYPELFI